jgi:hypothetical protein
MIVKARFLGVLRK